MSLTDKQKRFCEEYLLDLNATQAALRAGYSSKTAKSQGQRLLTKVDSQEEIGRLKVERSQRTQINNEWVLIRLKEISDRCMQAEEVMIRGANGEIIGTGEYKFDSSGAVKSTELLGRHVGFFEKDNAQSKTEVMQPMTDAQVDKVILALRESKSS